MNTCENNTVKVYVLADCSLHSYTLKPKQCFTKDINLCRNVSPQFHVQKRIEKRIYKHDCTES